MSSLNETTITLSCKAASGEEYNGAFKVRKRLTLRQRLLMDQIRRELMGPAPGDLYKFPSDTAHLLAKIQAHVIDSPGWWKNNSNGLDLLDFEPVEDLAKGIAAMEDEMAKDLKEKAEAALKDLKPA